MIKRANGDLIFPVRGNPPDCPNGYCRDSGNPFIFHLDLEPCKHREAQPYVKPCGKIGINLRCVLLCKDVNNLICDSCDQVEAP